LISKIIPERTSPELSKKSLRAILSKIYKFLKPSFYLQTLMFSEILGASESNFGINDDINDIN